MIVRVFRIMGLISLLMAMFVSFGFSLDPTVMGFGSARIPALKYMPYWLSFLASIFYLMAGIPVFNRLSRAILLFIGIMLAGSLGVFLFKGVPIEETYVGRALGGFVFIAFYLLSRHKFDLKYYMKKIH